MRMVRRLHFTRPMPHDKNHTLTHFEQLYRIESNRCGLVIKLN